MSWLCGSGLVGLAFVVWGAVQIGLMGRVWRSGFCCRSRAVSGVVGGGLGRCSGSFYGRCATGGASVVGVGCGAYEWWGPGARGVCSAEFLD